MKLAAAFALTAAFAWAADAPATAPVVKASSDLDWKASASLPPGAEYHMMYEDAKTHGVQLVVRMPKGYALPPHAHTADEVIYVLKGRVVLGFDGQERSMKPGGYAVVPAGTVFTLRAEGFGGTQFIAAFSGPFDAILAK